MDKELEAAIENVRAAEKVRDDLRAELNAAQKNYEDLHQELIKLLADHLRRVCDSVGYRTLQIALKWARIIS